MESAFSVNAQIPERGKYERLSLMENQKKVVLGKWIVGRKSLLMWNNPKGLLKRLNQTTGASVW